jgi:opine dehydrogenase
VSVGKSGVVLLGGDAVSVGLAGTLSRAGHEVVLWEAADSGSDLRLRPQVRLSGAVGDRTVTLAAATDDVFAALAAGDVVITCLPASARTTFTRLVLPLIEPRHTLVVLDGCLGSLAHAKWLRDHGRGTSGLPTLVESDVLPLVASMRASGDVHITVAVAEPGIGVFPAVRTSETLETLRPLLPGVHAHRHVLAAALASVVPFLRAATAAVNMGLDQDAGGSRALFRDAFSPRVARVLEVLDGERLALAAALGLELPTAADALHRWGLAPQGDLWAAVNGSYALTHVPGPVPERARQLDTPVEPAARSLAAWIHIADVFDVAVPLLRSIVALGESAAGNDDERAWSPAELGLAGLGREDIARFLETGASATA